MNRPLALIEGDLALPVARPFDALPPPFGSRCRPEQTAAQDESQAKSRTEAQRAIQNAVQRQEPVARRGPLPPGVKFLLFYKLPQQRDHSRRFDEQLAEARHYLEVSRARPCSTRSDHVMGAVIFAGCSIALAWLLATCTTHEAGKAASVAAAARRPAAIRPSAEFVGAIAQSNASAANPAPKAAVSETPMPPAPMPGAAFGNVATLEPQRAEHGVPHPAKRASADPAAPSGAAAKTNHHQAPGARLSKPHIGGRLALNRMANPTAQPSASRSAEWAARSLSANETAERAALFDWAARQRRATITTRVGVPKQGEIDWNVRMTQRRITDNPDAFQADHNTK